MSSSRAISKCIFGLDGQLSVLDWPPTDQTLLICVLDLEVGSHNLHVSLLPSEQEQAVAEGTFNLIIRAPSTRPSTGTFREGLMVLATPVNPTLTEIWDGKASNITAIAQGYEHSIALEANGTVQARLAYKPGGPVLAASWTVSFDQAIWQIGP